MLKTTLTPAALVGGVVAPAIGLLGGTLHGLAYGFAEGSDGKGLTTVPGQAARNVQRFHSELVDEAIEGLEDVSMRKPDRVYEIRVIEALRGLACGAFGAVVLGVAVALSTLVNLPSLYWKGTRIVWESGVPPFIVGGQVLLTAFIVLGPALVTLLSVLVGLGLGSFRGYSKGVVTSVKGSFSDAHKYHELLWKTVHGE